MSTANVSKKTDKKPKCFLSVFKWSVLIIVAAVSAVILAAAILLIIANLSEVEESREEYVALQEIVETLELDAPDVSVHISEFDAHMRQLNPDYICWIKIDGTNVDYPVVRGSDNERYLNISFSGEENRLGALFMDYRNVGDYVPHIIIYGHNSHDGSLFGDLWRFLDADFKASYPIITLIVNDRVVEYEIFSARATDVNDPAYRIDFSAPGSFSAFAETIDAPQDAMQIITLSTCYSRDDDDRRIIVQGALINN